MGNNFLSNFQTPQGTTPGSVLGGIGDMADIAGIGGQKLGQQQQPAQPVNFNPPPQAFIAPPKNPFYGG
jgi:hypothetical protein